MEAAAAVEQTAVVCAVQGDAAAARIAFERAASLYERLSCTMDLRRLQSRLRPHGFRLGPRTSHRRATKGWAALTPAELGVAALVESGCSNPDIAGQLFLSRRTVEAHVANIMRKLQVHSRLEIEQPVVRPA